MGFNSVIDAAPQETYQYLVQRLGTLKLAYVHLARTRSAFDYRAPLRPLFDGTLLLGLLPPGVSSISIVQQFDAAKPTKKASRKRSPLSSNY